MTNNPTAVHIRLNMISTFVSMILPTFGATVTHKTTHRHHATPIGGVIIIPESVITAQKLFPNDHLWPLNKQTLRSKSAHIYAGQPPNQSNQPNGRLRNSVVVGKLENQ